MSPFIPEMLEFIVDRTGFSGGAAIILGSGLGGFADQIEDAITIPYASIPNYPRSTVKGHSGEFVIGELFHVPVIAAKGRFHFYEGYDFHTVTLPIRLFHKLGVPHLIITNAAGSMNVDFPPGTQMALTGHLDCTFRQGPGRPILRTGVPYHDPGFIAVAQAAATGVNVPLETGVYCWTLGPGYETPAEIQYFRSLGGDAVGMSTVPEIQAAGEFGITTLGISTLTNYAAGITDRLLRHEEVIEMANRVQDKFKRLLMEIVKRIGNG